MDLRWIDSEEVALSLEEKYPNTDVLQLRFTALRQLILDLPNFKDDPNRCNERILEAIQMAWLEEKEDH